MIIYLITRSVIIYLMIRSVIMYLPFDKVHDNVPDNDKVPELYAKVRGALPPQALVSGQQVPHIHSDLDGVNVPNEKILLLGS